MHLSYISHPFSTHLLSALSSTLPPIYFPISAIMKSAALLSFSGSGLLAVLAWSLLSLPFFSVLALLLALSHLYLHYSSPSPQPPTFKNLILTPKTAELQITFTRKRPTIVLEARLTPTEIAGKVIQKVAERTEDLEVMHAATQTTISQVTNQEIQTNSVPKDCMETGIQPDFHSSEVGIQAVCAVKHQDVQYEAPQRPRNVQLQTYFETVQRAIQVSPETREQGVSVKGELEVEVVGGVEIEGKEEYVEVVNEVREEEEQEVAAVPEDVEEGGFGDMSKTTMDRILREIQVEPVPIVQEKPPPVEEIEQVAKMAYLNPIIQTHGKLLNSLLLSSTASMSDQLVCCFYLCLSPADLDHYFGLLPYDPSTLDIYPISPREQPRDEGLLSTWLLCSHMSDYMVVVMDIGRCPEIQYSEHLYRLFKAVQRMKKPLFVFHAVSEGMGFRDSERKFNDMMEAWGRCETEVTHFELGRDVRSNADIIHHIRDQMSDQQPSTSFETRYKSALESAINELYVIKNSRDKELPIEDSDIELSSLREGFLASVPLESSWKCSIREQYIKIVPETMVLVSNLQYHLDEKLTCQVRIAALIQAESCVMRCAVFSNLPDISFRQLNVISSFMVNYEHKSVLLLPFLLPYRKNSSNHINSVAFDAIFIGQLMRIVSNCLILNLVYDQKGDLIEPEDHFATLSAIIRSHYREFDLRGTKKPLLIIHNLQQDGNSEELYESFKGCLKKCTKLMNKWRHARGLSRVRTHKHVSEGFYAFDEEGQVIHRLVVAKPPNIGWVLYNSILFKIMYDAVVNDRRAPLTVDLSIGLRETIESLVEIRDEEVIHPAPEHEEGLLSRSPVTETTVFNYTIPLQPSWTLSLVGEVPGEEVSMSAEII